MAILVKGKTFGSTEQVTSAKLHQLVDSATFDTGAVDDSTIALSGGVLIVKDGGITGAKLSSTVAIPSAATATTQAADTNTTAIATTAFAKKEADDAQAYAIQRANHTGTQSYTTITGMGTIVTGSLSQASRAWVNFDGTLSGTITPRDGFNIASVVKNGTGDYTITFTNAMSNANYCITGCVSAPSAYPNATATVQKYYGGTMTTSSIRILTVVNSAGAAVYDVPYVFVSVYCN